MGGGSCVLGAVCCCCCCSTVCGCVLCCVSLLGRTVEPGALGGVWLGCGWGVVGCCCCCVEVPAGGVCGDEVGGAGVGVVCCARTLNGARKRAQSVSAKKSSERSTKSHEMRRRVRAVLRVDLFRAASCAFVDESSFFILTTFKLITGRLVHILILLRLGLGARLPARKHVRKCGPAPGEPAPHAPRKGRVLRPDIAPDG